MRMSREELGGGRISGDLGDVRRSLESSPIPDSHCTSPSLSSLPPPSLGALRRLGGIHKTTHKTPASVRVLVVVMCV